MFKPLNATKETPVVISEEEKLNEKSGNIFKKVYIVKDYAVGELRDPVSSVDGAVFSFVNFVKANDGKTWIRDGVLAHTFESALLRAIGRKYIGNDEGFSELGTKMLGIN